MAEQLGGKVESSKVREFGYAEVRARGHSKLLEGIQDRVNGERHGLLDVWMSHGDKVIELPPGFKLMATSDACAIAGMADESRRLYGVQFHPEVTHTKQGGAILKRFVLDICGARADWNMPDYVGEAVERIRAQVGKEEVVLGLSGGVDSSVAAALIHRAIGDRLTCIFVDTGLLAAERGRTGHGDLRAPPRRQGRHGRRLRAIHACTRRHRRPRGEAQDHRARVRARLPGGGGEAAAGEVARAGHDLSRRDRVGRRRRARRRTRSSRTTTSAACPKRCISSCSSRCATCSRTKCGSSAWHSACRARWCSGTRSRGRAWAYASSAR